MVKYNDALKKYYEDRWATCEVDYQPEAVKKVAEKLFALKPKYEGYWNVPWFFIALSHLRECNNNFKGCLHNGELIIGTGRKTKLVPAGRGPFGTWQSAAEDALKIKGLDKEQDWSVGKTLFRLEGFNGYGYLTKKRSSPYLWSHTNWYADGSWDKGDPHGGKYVRDHVWADVYDTQLGVCAVLKELQALDPTIFAEPVEEEMDIEADVPEVEAEPGEVEQPLWKKITKWATGLGLPLGGLGGASMTFDAMTIGAALGGVILLSLMYVWAIPPIGKLRKW